MRTCDISDLVASDQLSGLGAVRALESRLAEYYGMRYAVAMPSATTGLLALGLALDLRGTEFVTPPLTYGGSIAGWLALGASPRFADLDPDSLTLAPEDLEQALTSATRVVLGVDLFGHPCNDEELRKLADRNGVWFVVDAAQSFGARRNGRAAGSTADAVVVSFTTGKALDVAEGGAVLTNHRDLYERLVWHSQHPTRQKRELGLHHANELAINGRIHPFAARAALRDFDYALKRVQARRLTAFKLRNALAQVPGVQVPPVLDHVEPSYWRLTVRNRDRDSMRALEECLKRVHVTGRVGPLPVSILYRLAPFAEAVPAWAARCPTAEREYASRLGISFGTTGSGEAATSYIKGRDH
jgi:perosamine synthetase